MTLLANSPNMVFIPFNDGTKNLHPATVFGEFTTFIRHDLPTDQEGIETLTELCYTWLSDFNRDEDVLLLIGDPVLISIVSALTGRMNPWYNVLKWDRQTRCYIKIKITVQEE